MSDFYAMSQIGKLKDELTALEGKVALLQGTVDEMRAIEASLASRLAALVELLADAGQLDAQELAARIKAAAIGRQHEAREDSAASQDVWDTAKGKP